MSVPPVPDDYRAVTPYLIVPHVDAVLEFLQAAFGATVVQRLPRPDGSIMHAEVRIRDAPVMLGEPNDEWGPMPASIYLYVEDCDAVYRRAIDRGGESVMEPTTMHHAGERYGGVRDPGGNIWWIATHIEDVSAAEQVLRAAALGKA